MRSSTGPLHSLFVGLGLASISLTGCAKEEPKVASEDYADKSSAVYCEAALSCVCDDYAYSNFQECYLDLYEAYNDLLNQATLAGMRYDGSCPQDELEVIQNLDCKGYVAPLPAGLCIPPCNPFHGSLPAGSSCTALATSAELGKSYSNCAQGLSCISGVCADPCQAVGALPGIGEACPDLICEAGAMCDLESGTCVAAQTLPGPGQPCLNGACDPLSAVCVPAANTCAALPTIGQPCVEGQCDVNSYCDPVDEVCVAKPPLACFLLSGPLPGDGDGDPTTDPTTTGDGDGDPTTTGGACSPEPLPSESPYYVEGTTSTASFEGSCGGIGDEHVFSYVAPADGSYALLAEAEFDTVLYVRDGDCAGVELGCNDDDPNIGGTNSVVLLDLVAGQEIIIVVDSYDAGGVFGLTIAAN